jgi:hypothetical protein
VFATVGRTICSLLIVYLVTSKVNVEALDLDEIQRTDDVITERELEDNFVGWYFKYESELNLSITVLLFTLNFRFQRVNRK